MFGIGESFNKAWHSLWIVIDSIIYFLISLSYGIFNLIAKASLYNDKSTDISAIADRISIILGVGMLFILAYNIILNIMNPDKINNNDSKSMQGILKNAVIAIVMLTAYKTVFTYMANIQNHIMDSQVIENIILGTSDDAQSLKSAKQGDVIATKIFTSFFFPIDDSGKIYTYNSCATASLDVCQEYRDRVDQSQKGSILSFIGSDVLFDSLVSNKPHMYHLYIISSICGIITLFMFVSYIIDIGVRVAKMAFLQIIAPVPIIAYIIKPSGGMFSKWLDNLIKTYLSLFMRLITIYFTVFLVQLVSTSIDSGGLFANSPSAGGITKLLGTVIVIIGVLLFGKDAPKLLETLLGTTFGEGGGFSPKAIAKKLSGVRDVPVAGRVIGKGLDKANQGIGAAAGWYGARRAAIRNNKRLEKLQRQGKDTGGLTHMDVRAAGLQGRHNGYKNGGICQSKAQGESVFQQTYGYGKKQGRNGGFSRDTINDEKYGKIYEKGVKDHAKEQNDAIRNQSIGNDIPGKDDVAGVNNKVKDYMAKNADFEKSEIYNNAAKAVADEERIRGISYSDEERKAKINEKLSQISASTTNANEKRAIDSYLSRNSVIAEYKSSVLGGNKEAIAKLDAEAASKTNAIVKAEIESKGIDGVITDQNVKLQLEGAAQAQAAKVMASVNGDISALNIDADSMKKISENALSNIEDQIAKAGGIGNISLTTEQQASISTALQKQVTATISEHGGTANITLDATNQATFAATKQSMTAEASKDIEARLSAEFTQADETRIRNEVYSNSQVDEGGIIRNLSPQELKQRADQAVANAKEDKRQKIMGEVFDKMNEELTKVRDKLVRDQVSSECKDSVIKSVLVQEQKVAGAKKYLCDQEYKAGVEKHLYDKNYTEVENKLLAETITATANQIGENIFKIEEGRIKGDYTNNNDGSLDKVYNSVYVKNETISNDGITTKKPQELWLDELGKMMDERKKNGGKFSTTSKDDKK